MERGLQPWDSAEFRCPRILFTQTQIPREAALDLGPEGGVLESPSSTLASRGAQSLPLPPVPRCWPWACPPPHFHNVAPSFLPVRNQPVV